MVIHTTHSQTLVTRYPAVLQCTENSGVFMVGVGGSRHGLDFQSRNCKNLGGALWWADDQGQLLIVSILNEQQLKVFWEFRSWCLWLVSLPLVDHCWNGYDGARCPCSWLLQLCHVIKNHWFFTTSVLVWLMDKSSREPLGMVEALLIGLLHIGRCRMSSICVLLFHTHIDYTYWLPTFILICVCCAGSYNYPGVCFVHCIPMYTGTKLIHDHAHQRRNECKRQKIPIFFQDMLAKDVCFRLVDGHDQHPINPSSIQLLFFFWTALALQPVVGSRSRRALIALGPMELDENRLGVGNTGGLQGQGMLGNNTQKFKQHDET